MEDRGLVHIACGAAEYADVMSALSACALLDRLDVLDERVLIERSSRPEFFIFAVEEFLELFDALVFFVEFVYFGSLLA